MFKGCFTALVTPFRNGHVDEEAFKAHVEWQIAEGVHGLVPCGTTGESPTLTEEERQRVVEMCVETAAGRIPVIAGAGANDTAWSIDKVRHAKAVGADAALVVAPYYSKPNQEGLYGHFAAINAAVELPVFVYNVPGRTACDVAPETIARLSKLPNVVGIKDATGEMGRVARHRVLGDPSFIQLSGDDPSALAHYAGGGAGCISVVSNIAPRLTAGMHEEALGGRYADARQLADRLIALSDACFASPSPGPCKYVLAKMGRMSDEVRLPITKPDQAARAKIDAALELAGLELAA